MELAAKYRPRTFKSVAGQVIAKKHLSGVLTSDKKIPTFLFHGGYGLGKTSVARIVARRLNCSDPQGADPCLKCESCQMKNHPDIIEMNAADKRGIDEVRYLIDVCRLAPTYKHKVYIIDEAHALTTQAFQASLKLFEEPPLTATFIMVTTNPEKLPKTILSRCQKVRFNPVQTEVMVKKLALISKKEEVNIDKKLLARIADAAMGHPRDAVKLLDQVISSGDSDFKTIVNAVVSDSPRVMTQEFTNAILDMNLKKAFSIARRVDNAEYFLSSVVDLLRAVIYYTVDESLVDRYYQAQLKKMRRVDLTVAADLLKIFAEAYQQAKLYTIPAPIVLDLAIAQSAEDEEYDE